MMLEKKLIFWLILFVPILSLAQYELDKEVTQTYFLKNGNIKSSPEQDTYFGHLLIENGLIVKAGPNLKPPAGAQVIDLDSAFVYAGFIGGLSHTNLSEPERPEEKPEKPGEPTDEQAGITPYLSPSKLWKKDAGEIKKLRSAGFTIAVIAPEGNMLPGKAGLILTGKYPEVEDHFLTEDFAIYAQFNRSGRMYPSTPMGIMAKFRDIYRNASYKDKNQQNYQSGKVGVVRPKISPTEAAFIPVTQKQQPVIFKTESVLDIQRALRLRDDLGFKLMLTEVSEAWDLKEELADIPVFFTLDLPKFEKAGKNEVTDNEELEKLMERDSLFRLRYYSQIVDFLEADRQVGIALQEGKPGDVFTMLYNLKDHGLTEEQALHLLTTSPASILGIESVSGSIEPGKMANLSILDKPLLEEKTGIKWLFVEGKPFEIDSKPKTKQTGEIGDIAGTWSYSVETPGGQNSGEIVITGEAGSYQAVITSSTGSSEDETSDVTLNGADLTIVYTTEINGMQVQVTLNLTVEGETFEGTASAGEYGSFPVEGEKKPELKF